MPASPGAAFELPGKFPNEDWSSSFGILWLIASQRLFSAWHCFLDFIFAFHVDILCWATWCRRQMSAAFAPENEPCCSPIVLLFDIFTHDTIQKITAISAP
jgi:hypothetical protein